MTPRFNYSSIDFLRQDRDLLVADRPTGNAVEPDALDERRHKNRSLETITQTQPFYLLTATKYGRHARTQTFPTEQSHEQYK